MLKLVDFGLDGGRLAGLMIDCLLADQLGEPFPHVMGSDQQEIVIKVNLNLGSSSSVVWTTDLSYDYVKINAEYRS